MKDSHIWTVIAVLYFITYITSLFTETSELEGYFLLVLTLLSSGFSRIFYHLGE